MKEVKIGFIGLGSRGRSLIYNAMKPIKRVKITALCDKFENRINEAFKADECSNAKCFTDHKKMLKDADIDAVFVCVDPDDNVTLVCDALEAGKHVICDVPLTYKSIEDCWKIIVAVERSGMKFQMAEQIRYSPYTQAWKKMVNRGDLGKVVYAEGEYLHAISRDRYWIDKNTGEPITYEQAQEDSSAIKSRFWNIKHPIVYLPHELSPILSILEDRVVKVSCMGTQKQSYVNDFLKVPDIELAVMHTKKDTILRMTASFTVETIWRDSDFYHWKRLIGTKGTVELNRANCDKGKMYLTDTMSDKEPAEINWEFPSGTASLEYLTSGHGGLDCFPLVDFIESILNDTTPACDVYKACDITAPGILAAFSAEQGGMPLDVPDFRPGKGRKYGEFPKKQV